MRKESDEVFLVTLCVLISIFTIIIVIFVLSHQYRNSVTEYTGSGIDSRKIDITILEDKIVCEDETIFNLDKRIRGYSFYSADIEQVSNLDVLINDGEIIFYYMREQGYMFFNNFPIDKKIKVKLKYELEKDYICRYTNTDLFPFYVNLEELDYLKDLTINVYAEETLSDLTVKNAIVSNNNNKYTINAKNLKEGTYMDILFNIDTPINNTINSKYIDHETIKSIENYSYVNENKNLLLVLLTISILLFIVAFIVNRKKRINAYIKETDDLVSPILSEAIIDGKIGIKEMIMSTIIDLSIRGNIKIINDDILELVSLNNLEPYEKEIVELIFEKNSMTFNDINRIFTKSNVETIIFTKKINNIINLILQKLFSIDIFSKKLTKYNKIIKMFALLLSINLPFLLLGSIQAHAYLGVNITFNLIFILFNIKKNKVKDSSHNKRIFTLFQTKIGNFLYLILLFIIILIFNTINIAKYYTEFFIITISTIILNLYTAYLCRGFALTKNGMEEQAKLIAFKKYILDYSLMKDRDLKSTLIWDKYLAYATSFGIPNKITKKIDENCYNLRLDLIILHNLF